MNDKQVQDLIRGMFVIRIIDSAKAHRGRVQQGQGVQVQKMPVILEVICGLIMLGWTIILSGTVALSVLGLIMIVFNIS